MRISFDLDDTLILKSVDGPCEELFPARQGQAIEERLRKGTRDLFEALHQRGWEILIYSNSYRGKTDLATWFSEYGLPICGVVNQQLHDQKQMESAAVGKRPAKFPPWFQVDLHVDDAEEVYEDGRQFGFDVVRVAPDDPNWTEAVLKAADNKRQIIGAPQPGR
jgi:hypothetical protein